MYTDLALEAHSFAVERTGTEIPGVSLVEDSTDNARITRIEVSDEKGARALGKPPGSYVTIESDGLNNQNRIVHDELTEILGGELDNIINFEQPDPVIFVVGLGNWNATPDALGPQIMNHLMVTRHLYDQSPPEVCQGMRSVCALSPGVLGLTGIETAEIIRGVVDKVKPDIMIAIDALAARSTSRLGSTLQISDNGIYPGSGIGKNRPGINQQTMDIPVIAVGVPTVVAAGTIVRDALDRLMEGDLFSAVEKERFRNRNEKDIERTINNLLAADIGSLVVSPKGVDELIKDISRIIGGGINVALHPDITTENLSLYL
ncbi:MAG: GPR endopeptidase [Halanaerobiaceae bacterium]